MYLKIHHLGIAVQDLDRTTQLFRDILGLPHAHTEEVPSENAIVSFFPIGESSFELVKSTDDNSAISRFLEKRGPGIHHICLEVSDIDAKMSELRSKGVQFTKDQPSPGAHGARVAFIHPKSAGGILIELREGPPEEARHG